MRFASCRHEHCCVTRTASAQVKKSLRLCVCRACEVDRDGAIQVQRGVHECCQAPSADVGTDGQQLCMIRLHSQPQLMIMSDLDASLVSARQMSGMEYEQLCIRTVKQRWHAEMSTICEMGRQSGLKMIGDCPGMSKRCQQCSLQRFQRHSYVLLVVRKVQILLAAASHKECLQKRTTQLCERDWTRRRECSRHASYGNGMPMISRAALPPAAGPYQPALASGFCGWCFC